MARAMFEYTKTVLKKVSFDKDIFHKEIRKALQRLLPFEIEELYLWLVTFTKDKPELTPCVQFIKSSHN